MHTQRRLYAIACVLVSVVAALPASINRVKSPLEARQSIGATQNVGADCADMTIVFARGTTERGNAGTVVGPPLLNAVRQQARGRSVNMQGVNYPANMAGIMQGGDRQGSAAMANAVKALAANCPNTGIIISGYSQGAMLMHNAAAQLDPGTSSHITAAVSFGDPFRRRPVRGVDQSRTLVVCHQGDNVCQGGAMILPAHLTYGQDVGRAAAFIMQAANAGQANTGQAKAGQANTGQAKAGQANTGRPAPSKPTSSGPALR